MDLSDQGASSINNTQLALVRLSNDFWGNTVCRKDNSRTFGYFLDRVDEDRTACFKTLYYMAVVNNFVKGIDRRDFSVQNIVKHIDCSHYASAKPTWFG